MQFVLLIAAQLVVSIAGFALLWRRVDGLNGEIARLRQALEEAAENRVAPRARRVQGAPGVLETPAPQALARAARVWRQREPAPSSQTLQSRGASLAPASQRALALAALALAPAFGLFLQIDAAAIVTTGLLLGAAMMLVSLRPDWRVAAWAGVLTAGAWALIGFALADAQANPGAFSASLVLASAVGLAQAHWRGAAPGACMALAMSAAAIALGSQIGMVSPAGAGFGAIVALTAIVGAMSLRLEAMHLAAFGASLLGLFVLSGQDAAAIWFTPAAAWAGALFLGIAIVRTPVLGARGAALAGAGVVAPLVAITALHASHHGLADPRAAAGAFAALGLILSGLIGLAASQRAGAANSLKLTLWVLVAGAFAAFTGAIVLVAPAPIAAPIFAALSLGLIALNARLPDAAWRALACVSGALCSTTASVDAQMLLDESDAWPPQALLAIGLALPALLMAAAALTAKRASAALTAGWLYCVAIGIGVACANLVVRTIFSGGAPLSHGLTFVEAGAHIAVWLAAALVVGARGGGAREFAASVLGLTALTSSIIMGVLWLTPYWTARADMNSWLAGLGFLAPGLMFWANWVMWRARGANLRTRLAWASGALMGACFVTLEATRADDMPDWASAIIGAFIFAFAIVINFAPGVTATPVKRSYFEENLHRNRRGEQRRQAR